MKRHIIAIGYTLCLLAVFLISCNDDRNLVPTGVLYLNVDEDATLLTKAETEVTYESLRVDVLQGEDTIKSYNDYLTEVKGERLILPVGKYTVAVRSNGADGVAWETPLYAGQEEVEVKQGEITNTKVTCTIANTKVSVVYSDDMKIRFTDYQTKVSNPSGSLNFTRDEYRSGFFTPEKLTVQLNLVNNDGNKFTIKKVYPDIEPQYHYTFEFTIGSQPTGDDAGADLDITVDKDNEEVTYKIFIKEESLTNIGEPIAKIEGFEDGVYPYYTKGSPKPDPISLQYMLGKNNTLQSFKVTVSSPTNPQVTGFDLTKEEDKSLAASIGFPELPQPTESSDDRYTAYQMDLTKIVPKLGCVDDKPTVHTFTVDLLDDKYQEASITFAIQMMPDVDASVYVPICWSTFAVLRGNSLDESCYFVLTTPNGELVIDDQDKIKRDTKGNMSLLVTGLTPGVYKYKIFSQNDKTVETEEESFTIYDPITGDYNVPNLGFDDWAKITTNMLPEFGALTYKSGPYWAPNATNDFKQVYWESGNYGASAVDATLAQSTTDKATSSPSNLSGAQLTSTYAGISSIGQGAFSAGSVFIGTPTEVGMGGAKLKYGRLHLGLPTHLSGYYKYKPGSIDYTSNKNTGSGTDKAIIYIALSTTTFDLKSLRSGPDVIRFDKTAKEIFAYGELVEENTVSEYTHFDIPLVYLQNKGSQMPTYPEFVNKEGVPQIFITIVATSSIDGDAFTGSTKSVMYIDEFSLGYDYDAACFKGTEFEGLNPRNIND